ncbi:MAG TPA: pilus assembly protein N-terminal domain-containing protein [Vicinamibacterales bacterium]|nr:pilus assembly protein N-terminal domain-containing protein [Vicinamibacterales bacterium]
MARFRRTAFATFLLVIAIGGTTILWAQNAALPASAVTAAPAEVVDPNSVRLLVGRSTVVDVGSPVARVSLTSPDVADALVTSPNQLLINGKTPGTISMFVWDRAGSLRRYEIVVQRDLARLSEQLRQLFPGESIDAHSNGKNIVLSGSVTNKDVIEKAINVAAGYVDKREEVVPLLQIAQGAPSNQVLLRVRFAEVSRSAMTDLGATWFTGPNGYKNVIGRATTEQFGNQPVYDDGKMVFSDYLNLFLFDTKNQIGTVIKALQQKGDFQSLAEPNLVAESGKEASFLAGGEIPVPVATGAGGNLAITVTYKEFGIRLTFTPVVNGDRVHLKVRPEVSTLDFGNAVVLNGFRIPALSTRRTETELELQNGQTFAIAGLMDNTVAETMQKIPGLGDIPILGYLFKSKSAQKNQTELVVMITPEILPNNSRGVTPNLPRTPQQFMPPIPENKSVAPQPPAFGGVAAPAPVMASRPDATIQQGQLTPAAAAAVVSNLSQPNGPRLQTDAPAAQPIAVPVPVGTPAAAPVNSLGAPANAASPAASPTGTSTSKPLTEKELKALAKEQQEQQEKADKAAREQAKIDAKMKAEQDKQMARQAEADRKAEAKERERQEKLAKEQAKKDAEAARKAADAAKKQSQLDLEYRKSLDEAAEKLRQAQALYNAELAKSQQQQ